MVRRGPEPLGHQKRGHNPDPCRQGCQPKDLVESPLHGLDQRPVEALQVLEGQSFPQRMAFDELEGSERLERKLLREEMAGDLP